MWNSQNSGPPAARFNGQLRSEFTQVAERADHNDQQSKCFQVTGLGIANSSSQQPLA
jgi:hypothetical protein